MLKHKGFTAALIMFFMVTSANAGGGGGLVAGATEITQLLNNGQLLMEVSESQIHTANQIKMLLEMYEKAQRDLRHLQQLGNDVKNIATIAKERDLNRLTEMIRRTETLYGHLDGISTNLENRMQEAYQSGQSLAEYMKSQSLSIQRKEQVAVNRVKNEAQLIKAIQEDYDAVNSLANQITSTSGTQQSLGLMNTQMNKMLLSLNRLGQIMVASQENPEKSQKEVDELIQEQRSKEFTKELMQKREVVPANIFNNYDPRTGKSL